MQDEEICESAQRKRRLIGCALVICSAVCWGFSGACVQYLTDTHGVSVPWINSVRMVSTALILMPICLIKKQNRSELKQMLGTKQSAIDIVVYAIFGAFACQIGYLFTIQYTTAGTATMMEQLGLLIVMGVTCITARRLPTKREALALVLALGGTFCICTQGNPGQLAMPPIGLAWGIFAAISMATYILLPVRLLKTYSGFTVTSCAMLIAAVFCLCVFRPWTCAPELSLEVVFATLGVIFLGTIFAYLLFLEGVRRCGAVLSGLLDAFEPVTALTVTAVWLGTHLSGFDILGCALIICMMVLVTLPEKPHKKE